MPLDLIALQVDKVELDLPESLLTNQFFEYLTKICLLNLNLAQLLQTVSLFQGSI